jgi:hypothetical protein
VQIALRCLGGEPKSLIARAYGVSPQSVFSIGKGRIWKEAFLEAKWQHTMQVKD